jgi:hypothetical protein
MAFAADIQASRTRRSRRSDCPNVSAGQPAMRTVSVAGPLGRQQIACDAAGHARKILMDLDERPAGCKRRVNGFRIDGRWSGNPHRYDRGFMAGGAASDGEP